MSQEAILAVLFLLGAGCVTSHLAVAAPGDNAGKYAEMRQKALAQFDKNGNGQLDSDERAAAREAMQNRRAQGGKGQDGAGVDPERRNKLLARFDKDGDGKLNESERAAAKAAKEARAKQKS